MAKSPVLVQAVVYTGGTFDCLHAGHVHFLRQCAKIGEVVVALNTDEFIKEYKGKAPLYSYAERLRHLSSLNGIVSRVVPNIGGADSKQSILEVNPDFIVIGSDWACRDYYKQMGFTQDWLDGLDITLLYTPYYEGISTSDIKKRVCASQS